MGITAQKMRGVSLFCHFTAVRSICVFDRSCCPTQFLLLRVQSSPVLLWLSDLHRPKIWRSIDTMRRCQRARGKAVQVIKFCCSALAFNSNFCCCACNPQPFCLSFQIFAILRCCDRLILRADATRQGCGGDQRLFAQLAARSIFCCCARNSHPFVSLFRIPTYLTLVYVFGLICRLRACSGT
jgi:hypothetical protein